MGQNVSVRTTGEGVAEPPESRQHVVSPDANSLAPAQLALVGGSATVSHLSWLASRLATMNRRELAARLGQMIRVQADVVRGGPGRRIAARARRPRERRLDRLRSPAVLSEDRARLVTRLLPEQAKTVISAADRFAAGDFGFLGYRAATLNRPLEYTTDPFTGGRWPARHGLLLDYRSSSVGDPKWIWELNRLQHVPLLLAAALLTGDNCFRERAIQDLEAWLAQAQLGRGIAWSNGYEPALRALSLGLSLDALRGLEGGSSALRLSLLASLDAHVAWIRRYPSLYSSANNHRVGELSGLIVAAALAPELGLERVSDEALTELRARVNEQFAPDGTHREQAFGYAVFTAELLVTVAGVMTSTDQTVPVWLSDALGGVAQGLATQLGERDPEPRYGDRDDGGPTLLGGGLGRSGRSLLASLRYASGEREPGRLTALEPSVVWLLGEASVASSAPSGVETASACLRDTGLVVLRAGACTVTFDLGPLGFGELATHGHADALHVTVAHGGRLLVGDPGTGSYFGSPAVRDAFRGTGFHATVGVDGHDQAQPLGPFLWGSRPSVTVHEVDLERRRATGSHDGYERLDRPVSHRRTVLLVEEDLILVRDVLNGEGSHHYSQRWPLPPEAQVEELGPGRFRIRVTDTEALLHTVCSAACQAGTRTGSVHPFEGWWSLGLESIEPAQLVRFDATAAGQTEFVTLLAIGSPATDDRLETAWGDSVQIIRDGRARTVDLAGRDSLRDPRNADHQLMGAR